MTLTFLNSSSLIRGAFNNGENDKMAPTNKTKKYINIFDFPLNVDGKSVIPGEVFTVVPDVHILQLAGNDRAVEVTPENEKELIAKYSSLKEAWLKRNAVKPVSKKG